MAQHNVDARYGMNTSICRDQINYHYTSPPGSSTQLSPSLSFKDAPIDLLSSNFTGRKKELDHIGRVLGTSRGGRTPTRCAIYGIPGIGKTQLALRYAELSYNWQQYSVIFWISGASVEKLNQGFAKVLTLVGHPDRDHPEQSTRLTSARRWLEESDVNGCKKWLLIVDNIAREAVVFLKEHFPRKNSSGDIVLTTRTKAVAEAVAAVAGRQHGIIELCAPDLQDAAGQLLKEAGIDQADTTSASIVGAEALVKRIGSLPLAISQAASFARQSHKSLDDVLGLYQSPHKYEVGLLMFFSGLLRILMV